MAWYSTGTVSATQNSNTVTGSGTLFIANIRVGDGITIAGSTSLHQVTNIASDTQITISPAYTGATGSAKAYSVMPIQGYPKDLADQVKTVIQSFSSSVDTATTSAASAAASATAATASQTAAKTSETNAAASNTAATASKTAAATSQTAAKTSETNSKTSETNAAASATAAATSKTNAGTSETNAAASAAAAATSKTNAGTSETNAAASATAASTSATNASASATAAKTSETNAKTSETNAKTSETNAAASATAAATSKTNAGTSETNAAASKTAAATSATNAAASATAAATSASSITAAGLVVLDAAPNCIWHFDGTTSEGWVGTNLTLAQNTDSTMRITATTVDPQLSIAGTSLTPYSGALYSRIRAKITRRAGTIGDWDGKLFYSTSGHSYSSSYFKIIPNPNLNIGDTGYVDWDMANLTVGDTDYITSTITGLRIDFSGSIDGAFDVDYIIVGRSTAVTSFSDVQTLKTGMASVYGGSANLMAAEYTAFGSTLSATEAQVGTTLSVEADTNAFGGYWLKAVTTTSGVGWFRLGATNLDTSMLLKAGSRYIFSGTFKASSARTMSVQLSYFKADGKVYEVSVGTFNVATTPARYSITFTSPTDMVNGSQFVLYSSTVGTTGTVWSDMLMLEDMVGVVSTPSTFTVGYATRQMNAALVGIGLGTGSAPIVADANAVTLAGLYSVSNPAVTANFPVAVNGMLLHHAWNSTAAAAQIFITTSNGTGRMFYRSRTSDTWQAWRESLDSSNFSTFINTLKTQSITDVTAGRLLKVGDFGLSGVAIATVSGADFNGLLTPGMYSFEGGAWPNSPTSGNFYMLVSATATTVKQIAFYRGGANVASRFYTIASATWSAWDVSYTRASILGTVSQTSGVPTGAVFETGSNANGAYTKFADGTLICSGSSTNLTTSNAVASIYKSANFNVTFPAAFVAATNIPVPNLSAGVRYSTGASSWAVSDGNTTTTGTIICAASTLSTATVIISWIAIGRWF